MKKTQICRQLGVDMLDLDILKTWGDKPSKIKMFQMLIDEANINNTDENMTTDTRTVT